MHSEESPDANSELFKEDDDEAMYKNPYEIRLCYLISVSLKVQRAWCGEKTHREDLYLRTLEVAQIRKNLFR